MLTREVRTIILIILAALVNTIPRWLPYEGLYFKMQAFSILLLMVAAKNKKNTEVTLVIWDWAIGLAIGNVWDEFFGDPIHCGIIEIIVAITITLCTIYRIKRCLKEIKQL